MTGASTGLLRRTLQAPLWQHAAALAVLLAGVAVVIGTESAFVTDESFVVIQLDTIEDTGGWTVDHPFPEVDPEGQAFPLQGSSRYEDGYTLYGKHPLLIYLYLPIHRAFGLAGLVGASIAGTVAAAWIAGALAARIRRGTGPLAVWLAGVGSPLLFDAFVIHAHTLAAATAGLAALLAWRAFDERRALLGAGAVAAALVTALLRTEGVLYGLSLGVAVGVFALLRRRPSLVVLAAAIGATGPAAFLIDRAWAGAVAGSDPVHQQDFAQEATTFLEDRITSVSITSVMPGYRHLDLAEMATSVGAVLLVVGVLLVRRRPHEPGALLFPVLGAGLLAVRSVLAWGPIPGLLIAFVVGTCGIVLLRREVWRPATTRFLLAAGGGFVVAVAVTQYKSGGHTEWGGRYFALALPLLVPVAAVSLAHTLAELPERAATVLRACLGATVAALALLAVTTLRETHDRNRDRTDAVLAAAAELPGSDDGRPVVVTEDDQITRLARGRFEEVRFLNVKGPYVETYLRRLADEGVEELLLVSIDPAKTLERLREDYEVVGPIQPQELQWEGGGGLLHLRLQA